MCARVPTASQRDTTRRRDIDAYHAGYTIKTGLLHIKRKYLLTIAHRR
jgi:hypothetical protein